MPTNQPAATTVQASGAVAVPEGVLQHPPAGEGGGGSVGLPVGTSGCKHWFEFWGGHWVHCPIADGGGTCVGALEWDSIPPLKKKLLLAPRRGIHSTWGGGDQGSVRVPAGTAPAGARVSGRSGVWGGKSSALLVPRHRGDVVSVAGRGTNAPLPTGAAPPPMATAAFLDVFSKRTGGGGVLVLVLGGTGFVAHAPLAARRALEDGR